MIKTFDEIPNWIFDIDEVSMNVFKVIAIDDSGRKIVHQGINPEAIIELCKTEIISMESGNSKK